jgi:hypothetical protein
MSVTDDRWADLSSQNERVVQLSEPGASFTGCLSGAAQPEWAALASQRERLVDNTDPEFRLASSSLASTGMRLVAGAA